MEVLEPVTYSDLKEMWDSVNGVACDEALLKHLAEDMNLDTDADWAQILDHQPIVLNDRMMTDAVQSPHIQSEHSYSLTLNDEMPHSPFGGHNIKLEDYSKEMECFPCADVLIKQEPASPPASPHPHSLLKPTIVLAPRLKVEPPTSSGFPLPPTPPSCNGSDSEGSPSPASTPPRRPKHSPLISSQPKGATGVLQLTDEEKRTLLAEGYHIPQKLPLTKAEERSLKKIRRKIKNKISAQESRRKKKEYMDALEKKVQILSSENNDYKKRVDSLEGSNKSLLTQLQHLQALLEDTPNKRSRNATTQTISSSTVVRPSSSTRSEMSTEFNESTDAKGR